MAGGEWYTELLSMDEEYHSCLSMDDEELRPCNTIFGVAQKKTKFGSLSKMQSFEEKRRGTLTHTSTS